MPDHRPQHREPCGCVYREEDLPNDWIGHGWVIISVCRKHAEIDRREQLMKDLVES